MYSIETITSLIGARHYGGSGGPIGWLLTDSRSLCFPQETLFFALSSSRNDGHNYIPDLYRRGVRCFVVETLPKAYQGKLPGACFLKVQSSLKALQRLSERHREEFDIPIIGITGSNGKTMVKEWLYQILSSDITVTRSPRSYNSQIGVPLSVWLLNDQTQIGIFEAGISQKNEMASLRAIIQPTMCVLTNIGTTHQENFSSLEEKCHEKLHLMSDSKQVVYPYDDEVIRKCILESDYKGEIISWSITSKQATLYVTSIKKQEVQTTISFEYKNQKGEYVLPFIDDASIANSITVATVALSLGVKIELLAQRMKILEPVAMRLEVKEGQNGCILINDSYNSDVNSLDIALDFMNRRSRNKQGKHTLILSDIYQSGKDPEALYSDVSDLLLKRGVDKLIGIGKEISLQRQVFKVKEKYFFDTTQDFILSGVYSSLSKEVILLKGSRKFNFDYLTQLLQYKVHQTILEVNLKALIENLNYFRSFLKPSTKLACMVKADGYGAGAIEVAKTLQENRVEYLAVALADEGATLRKAGITCNIMVMNPEMNSFKMIFDNGLEPEVYSFRILEAIVREAQREGITGYPVHIKLDTGMHRLGFDAEREIEELIHRLKSQNAIIPLSVFSHFAGADSDDFDEFSKLQFSRFERASQKLQSNFRHKILRHMDNSAAIEHFPELQLDMCRLGIGLYGVNNRNNTMLSAVSTLKTTILQIRKVEKTETVGYSRKGVLKRDSIIGVIPIGYADGLSRQLGCGHSYCLVNGKKAPYVGNICMDVAMIDLTDIDAKEGDMVEIFGENLPVTLLSDVMGTIPYEVLTSVSNRVKRVYFQD